MAHEEVITSLNKCRFVVVVVSGRFPLLHTIVIWGTFGQRETVSRCLRVISIRPSWCNNESHAGGWVHRPQMSPLMFHFKNFIDTYSNTLETKSLVSSYLHHLSQVKNKHCGAQKTDTCASACCRSRSMKLQAVNAPFSTLSVNCLLKSLFVFWCMRNCQSGLSWN